MEVVVAVVFGGVGVAIAIAIAVVVVVVVVEVFTIQGLASQLWRYLSVGGRVVRALDETKHKKEA